MTSKIDFVILWVDGNDIAWQEKKAKFLPKEAFDHGQNRYRDWDNLKYWFRGVAECAPWVNKIHLITDGQVPTWLNTNHNKINLVNHSDYIPAENLPLFNSNAIEMGLNAIPGLSDKFVLFNDDLFLIRPVSPEKYFKNGLPVDMAGLTRTPSDTPMGRVQKNNIEIINRHYSKNTVILKNIKGWLNIKYGKTFLRTLLCLAQQNFRGIVMPHLSVAYLKSDFDKVWKLHPETLSQTQKSRFRDESDVTHFLFRWFRMCDGSFYPQKSSGRYFSVQNKKDIEAVANVISHRDYEEICINDCWENGDFEHAKNRIIDAFESIFPEKCEFEK